MTDIMKQVHTIDKGETVAAVEAWNAIKAACKPESANFKIAAKAANARANTDSTFRIIFGKDFPSTSPAP